MGVYQDTSTPVNLAAVPRGRRYVFECARCGTAVSRSASVVRRSRTGRFFCCWECHNTFQGKGSPSPELGYCCRCGGRRKMGRKGVCKSCQRRAQGALEGRIPKVKQCGHLHPQWSGFARHESCEVCGVVMLRSSSEIKKRKGGGTNRCHRHQGLLAG